MGDPPQAVQAAEAGTYRAGAGLIVAKLPDEIAVPLRRDEFQTICEGEVSEARASRDLCLGILFGSVVGIAGILATADWNAVFAAGHRFWFLFSMIVLIVTTSGSGVGAVIFWRRCRRITEDSAYSRLKKKLMNLYDEQQASQ